MDKLLNAHRDATDAAIAADSLELLNCKKQLLFLASYTRKQCGVCDTAIDRHNTVFIAMAANGVYSDLTLCCECSDSLLERLYETLLNLDIEVIDCRDLAAAEGAM